MRLYRGVVHRFGSSSEEDLKSNYERGRNPHPTDLKATVLYMAVSMFEDRDLVAYMCRRRPDRVGRYVAQIDLEPDHGVCVAQTNNPGHWSVWGVPAQLARFVTDLTEA